MLAALQAFQVFGPRCVGVPIFSKMRAMVEGALLAVVIGLELGDQRRAVDQHSAGLSPGDGLMAAPRWRRDGGGGLRRRGAFRDPLPLLLVVCEGEVTERLQRDGYSANDEPLSKGALDTIGNCFIIEDLACARGVFDARSRTSRLVNVGQVENKGFELLPEIADRVRERVSDFRLIVAGSSAPGGGLSESGWAERAQRILRELAAAVVGAFEGTIEKIVVLAVFLPVLAGQSGNTGCQALAVTLGLRGQLAEARALSGLEVARIGHVDLVAGEHPRQMVVRLRRAQARGGEAEHERGEAKDDDRRRESRQAQHQGPIQVTLHLC